jgi:transcriptional regulator with AAA-type ATPase domain
LRELRNLIERLVMMTRSEKIAVASNRVMIDQESLAPNGAVRMIL